MYTSFNGRRGAMDQMSMPDVQEYVEREQSEQEFLASLDSDTVMVVPPRENLNETFAFLVHFTDKHPEHSFLMFQTTSRYSGEVMTHIAKLGLPKWADSRDHTRQIEGFINDLFANPPAGERLANPNPRFTAISNGEFSAAANISRDSNKVVFDPFGFI